MNQPEGGDAIRTEFARLVSELLEEAPKSSPSELARAIFDHLGSEAEELPIHGENLPAFEPRAAR